MISPNIMSRLPERPKIADLATGTGIWLAEASQIRKDAELIGFDISDSQFIQPKLRASNLKLCLADIKEPFPQKYHSTFDLVHVRLMVWTMNRDDWLLVVRNACQILEPGGWLQWEENDANAMKWALRDKSDTSTQGLQRGLDLYFSYISKNMLSCCEFLYEAFRRSNMIEINRDVVCSDRLHHIRTPATNIQIEALEGIIRQQYGLSSENTEAQSDIKSLIGDMTRDASSGAYLNFYINCISGRKAK